MFFCFYFSFSSEWSLSTTSLGWLAMKAQEASSQCLGRSVLLLLSVCFSDLRALQNPIKSSSICWVYMSFFPRSAPALCVWAQSSYYTLCHPTWQCDSYVLISGYGCTSAFQPLVAKWWSDLPNLVSSHVTKSPSNAPFTISTTWIV